MGTVHVLGVRHHSPACARAVEHAIATLAPRYVLVEGPSDMNERLGELLLPHDLPVALYTYRLLASGQCTRATWSPFCAHSPEWVALRRAADNGATALFIDLPAWDEAFDDVENRYSDAHLQASSRIGEIARDLGFDATDTLWDHLFEDPSLSPADVTARLDAYFTALRADEPAGARDDRREAYMARWIAWAAREAGDGTVLVVCGGFHKPALESLWHAADGTARPEVRMPEDRVGTYLVPFSFRRLDSFAGYASGMPSPAFYQELWAIGAGAAEVMLFRALARLRARGQRVSTADAIAASDLMHGLARLRGHAVPARADVLDALCGALVKEALLRPAPWSTRAVLPRGTDPILVELIDVFSGEARGKLAEGTPQPPLLADIEAELARVELPWKPEATRVTVDAFDARDADRRAVLHRLRVLDLPGIQLVKAADLSRGGEARETWSVARLLETDGTVVERAVYGASLAQAALARIGEVLSTSANVRELADALEHAVLAGFAEMAADLVARARDAVERETSFAHLGEALHRFARLGRRSTLARGTAPFAELVVVALERAAWLLEGIDGSNVPYDRADVTAIAWLRDALDDDVHVTGATRDAVSAVFGRRARAASAPPAVRGASLGALWSLAPGDRAPPESTALETVAAMPVATLGDFLAGMFVTAREELLGTPLFDAVDRRLNAMTDDDFLVALPSVRQAFSFFPPGERLAIARRVVDGRAAGTVDARALLAPQASDATRARCADIEAGVIALADRYGLLPADDVGAGGAP